MQAQQNKLDLEVGGRRDRLAADESQLRVQCSFVILVWVAVINHSFV